MRVQVHQDMGPLPSRILSDPRLEQLGEWGNRLAAAGLSPSTSGNLSCRRSPGFLITRTGVPLATIGVADWVEVTGIGRTEGGPIVVESRGTHEASRDAALHAVLYERQPDVHSVFHLHVGNLEELHRRLEVPATDRHFPAGTIQSVEEIERFLDAQPRIRYFILIDHGIVACGATPREVGSLVEAMQAKLEGD